MNFKKGQKGNLLISVKINAFIDAMISNKINAIMQLSGPQMMRNEMDSGTIIPLQ